MIENIEAAIIRISNTHTNDAYIRGTLMQAETILRTLRIAFENSKIDIVFAKNE
jgi:hypothetical protein